MMQKVMIQKRILITGIPGSGKTCIGKFLQEQHGFVLEDIEEWQGRDERFLKGDSIDQEKVDWEIKRITEQNGKVVAVFGLRPRNPVDAFIVKRLKEKWNFRLFWFDGNQAAALRAYYERELPRYHKGSLGLEFYDRIKGFFIQVENIRASKVIEDIQPILINTFRADGEFKTEAEIVTEIKRHVASMKESLSDRTL